jgi:hypothetical protein
MATYEFLWTDEIIDHLEEHGVTPEDFEGIVNTPELRGTSRSSGRPCCWGETRDGRFVMCVYERLDDLTILPITAFEVPLPGEELDR